MTDKQKAIELSIKVMENGHFESNGGCQRKQIENALKEIADWKDKQFSMIIEKIIELYDKYPSNAVFSKNNVVEMLKTLKKSMEE